MHHTASDAERCILVSAYRTGEAQANRSLDELEELADTSGAETLSRIMQRMDPPDPRTYIGSGKLEELKTEIHRTGATLVVTDDELTGVQMKNLEDALDIKVIDRTILILDIFAKHATTKEGKLQVELAQLTNLSTHLIGRRNLSRLGGGIGTRGPGEKQLETDRRHIRNRINNIRHDLKEVKRHRELTRKAREKSGIFTFSIVGYTNAGKSTLLNQLTDAGVLQEDKLFATLDLTTRELVLPNAKSVLLTDTVGFIDKLPHGLVEAFRGTLEEARYSDALIHVVDVSEPDYERRMQLVYRILEDLKIDKLPIITVFNKMDKAIGDRTLKDERAEFTIRASLIQGFGIRDLLEAMTEVSNRDMVQVEWIVGYTDAAFVNMIREKGHLISEEYLEDGIHINAYVTEELFNRWMKMRK